MSITAAQVNDLRQKTGVSMMECKKALTEADGNEEKAIEILRKRGAAKAAEKSGRETKQGIVVAKVSGDKAVVVKLLCETDFVAGNEEFVAIAQKAADVALKNGADQARAESESAIKELFTKLGENMSIEIHMMQGSGIGAYIHTNKKIGVLVRLNKPDEAIARDIAMHVAAMNPKYVKPEEIPAAEVEKEKEIWKALLKTEDKPEAIWDKIMIGKEKKYREENALMKQSFVKDQNSTVEQYLSGNSVEEFMRISI